MRVNLDAVDLDGMHLSWPSPEGIYGPGIQVRQARRLRGDLSTSNGETHLDGVKADLVWLDSLALVFGSLSIKEETEARFTELKVRMDYQPGEADLNAGSATLFSQRLVIETPSLHISGGVHAEGFEVVSCSADGTGAIRAARAVFRDLRVQVDGVSAYFAEVTCDHFYVTWDEDHIRYGGQAVSSPRATIELPDATVTLGAIAMESLDNEDAGWGITGLSVDDAAADVTMATRAPSEERPASDETPTIDGPGRFAAAKDLLDGLRGRLSADIDTTLAVPIIARRNATHRPRLLIDDGTLFYPDLIKGLSLLEETLLDLSLEDQALTLSFAPPLMPGPARELVRWPLPEAEVALARRNLVRVARLLDWEVDPGKPARLAAPENSGLPVKAGEAPQKVELKRAQAKDILVDLQLAEAPALPGPIPSLSVGRALLKGHLGWAQDAASPPGELELAVTDLAGTLRPTSFGGLVAAVNGLTCSIEARVALDGLRPTQVRLALSQIGARRASLTSEPE